MKQSHSIINNLVSLARKLVTNKSGVSLIELLIVIVLLGIAFTGLTSVLTYSSDVRAEAEIRTIQETLAKDLMNQIRSRRFDEFFTEEWSTSLGPEEPTMPDLADDKKVTLCHVPEGNPENAHMIDVSISAVPTHLEDGDYFGPCFDDVDDYDGWWESEIYGYPHYSRSVSVVYVDPVSGLETPVTGPTDYKLVKVTVGHTTLSDIVESLVIATSIPSHHYGQPFCLAGGLELKNIHTKKKQIFYGPFPQREMTFTVDGGTGTFVVDCTVCLEKGDISNDLEIEHIYDSSGEIDSECHDHGKGKDKD